MFTERKHTNPQVPPHRRLETWKFPMLPASWARRNVDSRANNTGGPAFVSDYHVGVHRWPTSPRSAALARLIGPHPKLSTGSNQNYLLPACRHATRPYRERPIRGLVGERKSVGWTRPEIPSRSGGDARWPLGKDPPGYGPVRRQEFRLSVYWFCFPKFAV